jgi:hypothetical protein
LGDDKGDGSVAVQRASSYPRRKADCTRQSALTGRRRTDTAQADVLTSESRVAPIPPLPAPFIFTGLLSLLLWLGLAESKCYHCLVLIEKGVGLRSLEERELVLGLEKVAIHFSEIAFGGHFLPVIKKSVQISESFLGSSKIHT